MLRGQLTNFIYKIASIASVRNHYLANSIEHLLVMTRKVKACFNKKN